MKKIFIVVAVLLSIVIFASCGQAAPSPAATMAADGSGVLYDYELGYSKKYSEGESFAETPAYAGVEEASAPMSAEDNYGRGMTDPNVIGIQTDPQDSILQPNVDRKIVYNGSIAANTKEFDKDCDMILSTLLEFGGYVESSSISGTKPEDRNDRGRTAQMVIRVPNKKFDTFISMLKGVGQNKSSQVSGQDISLSYYDREAQLAVLKVRQQKALEFFDKATDSTAQINFFNEYTNVTAEIQRLETDLRTYDSLIDFSTISITLYEVLEITAVAPAEESLGSRISNGFYSALNGLADFGEGVLVFFASSWPVLIILIVVIILIIIFVKRSNKKRGASKLPPIPPQVQGGQSDEKKG